MEPTPRRQGRRKTVDRAPRVDVRLVGRDPVAGVKEPSCWQSARGRSLQDLVTMVDSELSVSNIPTGATPSSGEFDETRFRTLLLPGRFGLGAPLNGRPALGRRAIGVLHVRAA